MALKLQNSCRQTHNCSYVEKESDNCIALFLWQEKIPLRALE